MRLRCWNSMVARSLAAIFFVVAATAAPQELPSAATLVAQGWMLVPAYDGSHRPSLDGATRRRTAAAALLFAAACELDPTHPRAHGSLGHAEVLLAEGARSRRRDDLASHVARAEAALTKGLQLVPEDPWAAFARGARVEYEHIIADFPDDPQAYALLGYLARLLEDAPAATQRLQQALERDRVPGIYTRL